MTKETLLKYDGFIDNEYLDQYINLVNTNINETIEIAEYHHVIPACWYGIKFAKTKINTRTIANADIDQELVRLSVRDHRLAHQLLLKCTFGIFNDKLQFAYEHMDIEVHYTKKKNINKIAKKIWHADHSKNWDVCKAEAALIYNQNTDD